MLQRSVSIVKQASWDPQVWGQSGDHGSRNDFFILPETCNSCQKKTRSATCDGVSQDYWCRTGLQQCVPRKVSYKNRIRVGYRDDLLKKYSRAAGECTRAKKGEAKTSWLKERNWDDGASEEMEMKVAESPNRLTPSVRTCYHFWQMNCV